METVFPIDYGQFDVWHPDNQRGQRLQPNDHPQHRRLTDLVDDWNELLDSMPWLHVWVWSQMPSHIVTNLDWSEKYDPEVDARTLRAPLRGDHAKHYYVGWVKRVQLAADGSGPLQVIYRQRLFCRAESLNPRAYRDRNWPAMDCRVVQHYFNALAEKSRPCQSWLVWTQMRLVALNWTDDVTFDVVTMTGDTISITCPEMRLISEVHQLIKTQLGHLKDKDISLCKDVVLMEPDAIGTTIPSSVGIGNWQASRGTGNLSLGETIQTCIKNVTPFLAPETTPILGSHRLFLYSGRFQKRPQHWDPK